MKLVNINTHVEKDVDEVTGKLMLGTHEWELAKEKGTLKGATENVSK